MFGGNLTEKQKTHMTIAEEYLETLSENDSASSPPTDEEIEEHIEEFVSQHNEDIDINMLRAMIMNIKP